MLPHREVFFGGAGGGGKSVALMMAAAQYVDVPKYKALLLRRTYPELIREGGLIELATEMFSGLGAGCYWQEQRKRWKFPSGASITFGAMQGEEDKRNYDGSEWQFIGFDEGTSFSRTQYLYMFSRLRRTTGVEIPLRMRIASNPGNIGHEWVKERFVSPGSPERPFIPATIADNPYSDRKDYEKSLAELDPYDRARIMSGDWDARPAGEKFKRIWFDGKIIKADALPEGIRWVRAWDRAATVAKPGSDPDYTVGAKVGVLKGRWYIDASLRFRGTPRENEITIRQTADLDGRACPIWIEMEGGSSGKDSADYYRTQVLVGCDVTYKAPTTNKEIRANPVASAAEAGNIFLIDNGSGWIAGFLDRLCAFPQKGVHDDEIDAISLGFEAHTGGARNYGTGCSPVGVQI
jgi:predicted phage terminase large subunit-like protein